MKRCWGMHCRPAVRGMVLLMVLVWLCGSAMAATWTHQTTGSWEYWYRDGLNKFRFNNTTGQWWHYGALGTWQTLSGTGLTYTGNIGDGGWYNLGTGFTYRYYDPYDTGYFQQDGKWRFRYGYQLGQWYNTGDILSWQTLGAAGQSGAFIGSGAWYALGNGFSYKFYAPQNAGYFKQGDDYRFLYLYGTGEWRHTGDTALSWRSLGGVGQTASFLGDGLWHDLGNGVSYCFMTGGYSSGYFKIGTSYRFKYQYGPGQWFHTGNTVSWQRLGGSGESALFMGDGYWHNIGNGFTYRYYAPQDAAYIKDGAAYRFLYLYGPQEWRHTGNTLSWRNLGGIGQTASFMGDGAAHDLGNGFMYSYLSGQGYWKLGAASRFRYDYAAGQWAHIGAVGGWTPLGPAGWSASFVGDGSTYDLGNGFTYSYTLGTDTGGYFQAGLTERFRYVYGTGGWFHYGQFGGWQSLASGLGAQFVGDGGSYSLGNGFTYTYSALTNTGSWLSDALGFTKFAYDYAGGQWYDYDKFANQYALGAAGNSVGEFMGDGTAHVLDAIWSYLFDGAVGQWQTGGSTRFRYAYATGQWSHDGPVGGAFALSAAGLTGQFIGSYTGASPADLGNGFSYWHDAATGVGHWLVAGISFFDYDYAAGRWSHYGPVGGAFALSAANVNAGFVGDGSARDLGNGFLYSYGAGEGTWSLGTANRFSYNYATGQWSHMGAVGGWVALGSPGWNASFIGEGSHDLGNGFTYAYNALGDFAGYLQGGTTERFRYAYGTGDWTHFDWSNAPWLLASARPADFVGTSDPAGINLGNGFAYRYASNVGYWMVGGANRFNYDYTKGTWSHYGFGTGPIALTAAGTSGQFIGDGQTLPFDANFSYWYELATDRGHWVLSGTAAETFGYDYATGQWNDYIASRGWRSLGEAGQSLSFIGDGAAHNLGGNLRYTYDLAAGLAYYYFDPIHQFRQSYTTAVMEYLHDTNVWSTWSANTAPPGTFSGVSAAPSSSSYMGIAGGSVWFITSNMLYRWDGNSFQTLAPSGTFTSLTALGNAGGNQYFLGYGGTSGAGYDIYQYDGTTFQEISGNKNYGTTTWVGAIGNVPYFRINGGTGHTGWDLFNFSGNTFNNLSNMGFTTMDLLVTAGGSFYFNGNGGTGHTGRDLFSWNGTWNQLSNGSYGGSIAYLASLDSQLFFRVSDNDLYGWYHLYSWNGTWNNISGAPQYSVVTYIGNIGNEAFFQMLGGGHTG
ncbi:MAG: hypothetical protein LDL33_04015, partial [Desulfomonile sp.]|nr:hypothetical protein [Desulfomonile sp.]